MLNSQNVTLGESVRQRVTSCFKPRPFTTDKLQSTVMGTLIGIGFAEVTIYMLLRNSAEAGEIPVFVADVLLVCLAAIELLLAPFMSWIGSWRPRQTMILWHVVIVATVSSLMFISVPVMDSRAGSDLCQAGNVTTVQGLSAKSIVSLTFLIVMGISCILARISIWSQAIAFLDEQDPHRMSMHLSVLLLGRMLSILLVQYIVRDMVPNRMVLHTLSITMPCLLNLVILLIFRMEPRADEAYKRQEDGRGFFTTLGRVLSNWLALVQIVGMGLLAAGLWGFAVFEREIVKAKYHIVPGTTMNNNTAVVLQFKFFIIFAIIMFGFQNSAPILPKLNLPNGVKRTVILSIILGAMYVILAVMKCQTTPMAGLSVQTYNQPSCSQQCGCSLPWDQFSPICDLNSMTTYISPCQAGCSTNTTLNGITIYNNCTCGVAGSKMTAGPCSVPACQLSYQMHNFLYTFVVTMTILGFQSQGTVMLRVVDPRDKAVAFGVLSSVIALFAAIGGHLIYTLIISGNNCAWYQGGKCLLQTAQFPVTIVALCASLAFLTAVVNLITFIVLTIRKYSDHEE